MRPADLRHLTLNTGHLAVTPRADVRPATLALLRPMVAAGGGEPLGILFRCRYGDHPAPGWAEFIIGPADAPYVVCVACWAPEAEGAAWERALFMHAAAGNATAPDRPSPVPWLTVTFQPGMFARPELLPVLGDMERCVAWALIEGTPANGA